MLEAPGQCGTGNEEYNDEGPSQVNVTPPQVPNFNLQTVHVTTQRRGLIGKEHHGAPKLLIFFFEYLATNGKFHLLIGQQEKFFICCSCSAIACPTACDRDRMDRATDGAWNIPAKSLSEYANERWQVARDILEGALPKEDTDAFD
jgi:hypothetical protein